jgi:curli biogenesis system outer membrane secretion channel CsgG
MLRQTIGEGFRGARDDAKRAPPGGDVLRFGRVICVGVLWGVVFAGDVYGQADKRAADSAPQFAPDDGGRAAHSKRRVAVLDFNHTRVLSSIQAIFGSDQNLGKYFSDILANRLTADNVMHVVDRAGMSRALQEPPAPVQDNAQDNAFKNMGSLANLSGDLQSHMQQSTNPATPAYKVGAILGVDPLIKYFEVNAVVTGEIVVFGREEEKRKGVLDLAKDKVMRGCKKSHAVVAVNLRMTDVTSGELITSARLSASSRNPGCNMLTVNDYAWPVKSVGDNNFALTPLGDALNQVAVLAAQALDHDSPLAPVINPMQIDGKVADVSGDNVTINVGSVAGVHVGDVFLITHVSRTIMDPVTNKPMRTVEDPIGQLTITSVEPFYSIGRFAGVGKASPTVRDAVRSKTI